MQSFKQFHLVCESMTSQVRQQMESIKNGTSEWDGILREWIRAGGQFESEGPRHFKVVTSKPVPNEIKRKYPDVIFALQALTKHLGGYSYFRKWKELDKYLTFKTSKEPVRVQRFWTSFTQKDLDLLKGGQSLKVKEGEEYQYFTRHSQLFGRTGGYHVMNIGSETLLQTHGRSLVIVTSHTILPIFNVGLFAVHVVNAARLVFGNEIHGLETLRNFHREKEIIGDAIKEIKPQDVVGYYDNATFNTLHGDVHEIEFIPNSNLKMKFFPEHIDILKSEFKKYNAIESSFNGHRYIVTSHPENSVFTRQIMGNKWYPNEELTKLIGVGIQLYTGVWK